MWIGVIVVGYGLWLLSSNMRSPSGETEDRPEIDQAEFTEWAEIERIPQIKTKLNPDPTGYYCIEQRDYMQGSEILFSQWRVQVKGSDNNYTVSTIYETLEDAQAKVDSMNQKPSAEDYDLAEEKGLIPDDRSKENEVFITPTFGGK